MRTAFLSCEARLLMSASALWRQDSGLAGKAIGLSMQQVTTCDGDKPAWRGVSVETQSLLLL